MRRYVILAALSLIATSAQGQSANQVAIIGCQNTAVNEIRAQRPEADSVRFVAKPVVSEKSKRETEVYGAGQYLDRTRREWRPFIYRCSYSPRSAATRVTLEIDSSSGTM